MTLTDSTPPTPPTPPAASAERKATTVEIVLMSIGGILLMVAMLAIATLTSRAEANSSAVDHAEHSASVTRANAYADTVLPTGYSLAKEHPGLAAALAGNDDLYASLRTAESTHRTDVCTQGVKNQRRASNDARARASRICADTSGSAMADAVDVRAAATYAVTARETLLRQCLPVVHPGAADVFAAADTAEYVNSTLRPGYEARSFTELADVYRADLVTGLPEAAYDDIAAYDAVIADFVATPAGVEACLDVVADATENLERANR